MTKHDDALYRKELMYNIIHTTHDGHTNNISSKLLKSSGGYGQIRSIDDLVFEENVPQQRRQVDPLQMMAETWMASARKVGSLDQLQETFQYVAKIAEQLGRIDEIPGIFENGFHQYTQGQFDRARVAATDGRFNDMEAHLNQAFAVIQIGLNEVASKFTQEQAQQVVEVGFRHVRPMDFLEKAKAAADEGSIDNCKSFNGRYMHALMAQGILPEEGTNLRDAPRELRAAYWTAYIETRSNVRRAYQVTIGRELDGALMTALRGGSLAEHFLETKRDRISKLLYDQVADILPEGFQAQGIEEAGRVVWGLLYPTFRFFEEVARDQEHPVREFCHVGVSSVRRKETTAALVPIDDVQRFYHYSPLPFTIDPFYNLVAAMYDDMYRSCWSAPWDDTQPIGLPVANVAWEN